MDATFVDSNVPMYLVGAPHANRDALDRWLRANTESALITSAEVYQEIVHRFTSINRREAIAKAFELLDVLVETIHPIEDVDVRRAHTVVLRQPRLSARDALHVSVMERYGVRTILTLDPGFDLWPGVRRLP